VQEINGPRAKAVRVGSGKLARSVKCGIHIQGYLFECPLFQERNQRWTV